MKLSRIGAEVGLVRESPFGSFFSYKASFESVEVEETGDRFIDEYYIEQVNQPEKFERQYSDQNTVPRPPHWSGWRLMPKQIEFWLDGEGRIHERLNYKKKEGRWEKELLYP